jgi:hypothetical protein
MKIAKISKLKNIKSYKKGAINKIINGYYKLIQTYNTSRINEECVRV